MNSDNRKYIFITGGVLSGLGKGVLAASLGKIIQNLDSFDKKISICKMDGMYSCFSASNLRPEEHGEVFVTDDGGELDLDFGTYYRFLGIELTKDLSITSGKIIKEILERETEGFYLGETIQVIPHITSLIREKWEEIPKKNNSDIIVIEIGGTVGDLENLWFLEAAREMIQKHGKENVIFIHMGYIPEIGEEKYQKTKPFQQSIQLLRDRGIFPDILVGRCSVKLFDKTKQKLNWLCNIPLDSIFSSPDLNCIYDLPVSLKEEGLDVIISKKIGLSGKSNLINWNNIIHKTTSCLKNEIPINIAICGKYTNLHDSYISIKEALFHSVINFEDYMNINIKLSINYIDSEELEKNNEKYKKTINECDGIIVPGGFGSRGVEGKIEAIKYCREKNIPFLGICYGLQLAVVEFSRNICNLKDANTTEIDKETKYNVIDILPEQKDVKNLGGTMRLGSYPAKLKEGTKTWKIYDDSFQIIGQDSIVKERHRHRYEVNPEYHKILEEKGLVISGTSPDGHLVEFIENPKCDFFVATQAHPEFKSRPENPAPLFDGFIQSILNRKKAI